MSLSIVRGDLVAVGGKFDLRSEKRRRRGFDPRCCSSKKRLFRKNRSLCWTLLQEVFAFLWPQGTAQKQWTSSTAAAWSTTSTGPLSVYRSGLSPLLPFQTSTDSNCHKKNKGVEKDFYGRIAYRSCFEGSIVRGVSLLDHLLKEF